MEEEKTEIFDFGFSTVSEDAIKKEEKDKANKIADAHAITQMKLKRVKDKIWPLLEALKKNPQDEMIKWSNRMSVITRIMSDIESIISE